MSRNEMHRASQDAQQREEVAESLTIPWWDPDLG